MPVGSRQFEFLLLFAVDKKLVVFCLFPSAWFMNTFAPPDGGY
jgi:hypothetical protein